MATLGPGRSFGEQALLNNRPRAASIECLAPCFFAVLNRKDYERSFGKVQTKHAEAMVKFYMSCPVFQGWTKGQLGRLGYYFKRAKHSMGTAVYRRGDICSHIYLVYEGEYEQTQEIVAAERDDERFDHSQYLMAGWDDPDQPHADTKKSLKRIKPRKQKFQHKCCILGRGQLIGEEDAIGMVNYTKTVKCKSAEGSLLEMSVSDFYDRIKVNGETWSLICKSSAIR